MIAGVICFGACVVRLCTNPFFDFICTQLYFGDIVSMLDIYFWTCKSTVYSLTVSNDGLRESELLSCC